MLPISKLRDARRAAKVSKQEAAKHINKHKDSITRLEDGDILPQLEDLCRLYGFNICLLTDAELEILQGIVPFLGKNGGKKGKMGE